MKPKEFRMLFIVQYKAALFHFSLCSSDKLQNLKASYANWPCVICNTLSTVLMVIIGTQFKCIPAVAWGSLSYYVILKKI